MNSRHRAREIALQILYRYDVAAHSMGTPFPEGSALAEDLKSHFKHFDVPQSLQEFAAQLVAGTLQELSKIDQILEKFAVSWKISRMGFVDRCLLRMAIYEMLHFPDIPHSVTLDEAIELGKQFGTADTPAFVNGILDAVCKEFSAQSKPS
jgi:N utilization substance protein B